ncbi:MAG: glycoside hydrolase [marine bacterium B5-7]|nr:MAG: glycoside hydrolase [marine bacterium B5-7]
MKILILAPHPFYIVRGTPIDLDLVLKVLSARPDTEIDLVVYAAGEDREYPRTTLHRVGKAKWMRPGRPGFSVRKLLSTAAMFWKACGLVWNRMYDVIHADEEAVFLAMFFRVLRGIPYVYDIDSSIAEQLMEQMPYMAWLAAIFGFFERLAMRGALYCLPVCNSLAELCRRNGVTRFVTLHDISQLANPDRPKTGSLAREIGVDKTILLYVGNLEKYQGIDLLLEGFAVAAPKVETIDLVIIGGSDEHIRKYQEKAKNLGVAGRVHFLGPRPFDQLDEYLAEADILTAPRIRGRNTPMKVFPYLHAGRPVLVTDLPTHSQILTPDVAYLAKPDPEGFGAAIVELANDPELRDRLAKAGVEFIERGHTLDAHKARLDEAYDWIADQISYKQESNRKQDDVVL